MSISNREARREQLIVEDLHAYYGQSHILHGVNMAVRRGELVTLLGRNGAGRSTTLRAIMNMVGKRSGSIIVNGTETMRIPAHQIA
ncbi:MAG: ATP-binding cassette domain-containing protein, partial [Gammaproteobacteria bacterium]|nr:ATP-binding cassette domain-containing protein [Gammaproteobacteria bacterium]